MFDKIALKVFVYNFAAIFADGSMSHSDLSPPDIIKNKVVYVVNCKRTIHERTSLRPWWRHRTGSSFAPCNDLSTPSHQLKNAKTTIKFELNTMTSTLINYIGKCHDDVINWEHFPRYWPFVRGAHRSPVDSPHKGQWRGASMFSLICARTDGWASNREAGDLRCHRAHYDVIVMIVAKISGNCHSGTWKNDI